MDPKDKAKIREAALQNIHRWMPLEERKERKRRAQERRANAPRRRPRRKQWSEEDGDDGLEKLSGSGGKRAPRASSAEQLSMPSFGDGPEALVVGIRRGRARVLLDGEETEVELDSELARTQQTSIAVGDVVELSPWGDSNRAASVRPRSSFLARPDPANEGRERVLAANIDMGVVVLSVVSPPLRPALIDRFLVALEFGGVAPVLCVNKLDLLEREPKRAGVEAVLAPYRALGIPCVLTSARSGQGVRELRALLRGRTCVFAGHSGVGKSSLLNALDPDPERARETGDVREGDGKGRHTTTSSALRELEGGTRVIDTPGIRSFGLWRLDPDGLRRSFREFDLYASGCRFRDCTHVHEPSCAVIAASESGAIAPSRHAAYLRLLAEI